MTLTSDMSSSGWMIFAVPGTGSIFALLPGNDPGAVADKFDIAAAADAIVVKFDGAFASLFVYAERTSTVVSLAVQRATHIWCSTWKERLGWSGGQERTGWSARCRRDHGHGRSQRGHHRDGHHRKLHGRHAERHTGKAHGHHRCGWHHAHRRHRRHAHGRLRWLRRVGRVSVVFVSAGQALLVSTEIFFGDSFHTVDFDLDVVTSLNRIRHFVDVFFVHLRVRESVMMSGALNIRRLTWIEWICRPGPVYSFL